MTLVQAVILGIIQGVAEFLPISSSAHLFIVPWLLGWEEHSLTFDVALHMGTLAAVLAVFWRDLYQVGVQALTRGLQTWESRFGWALAVATLPAAVAGAALEEVVETTFRSPLVSAFTLAALGIALWYVDQRASKRKSLAQAGFVDVVYVGIAQVLALVPGVSRSGVTMTAGLLRGLDRQAAARTSFLLSFPITLGAGILKLRELTAADLTPIFWAGVLASAVTGYVVIRFLLDYLRRGTYATFAVYRVGLAAVIVFLWAIGLRTV